MKYLRRQVMATGSDESEFPVCVFCGKRESIMNYTVEKKVICFECIKNDKEAEFVDR